MTRMTQDKDAKARVRDLRPISGSKLTAGGWNTDNLYQNEKDVSRQCIPTSDVGRVRRAHKTPIDCSK